MCSRCRHRAHARRTLEVQLGLTAIAATCITPSSKPAKVVHSRYRTGFKSLQSTSAAAVQRSARSPQAGSHNLQLHHTYDAA
jgi:hypothetical protein